MPNQPKPTIHKVYAYITHGTRLLVFEQPDFPEAGIQVPGGTLEHDETPQTGVLREAQEETGLDGLEMSAFLGEYIIDVSEYGKNEIHHRHVYHLIVEGDVLETWEHHELHSADKNKTPVRFRFYWAEMPDDVPVLIAGFGAKLPTLYARLNID